MAAKFTKTRSTSSLFSTPPHVMPAPQPGISWLETIGQYLPPVEQLLGRFYY